MTEIAQVSAKISPSLKKEFIQAAKRDNMPASSILTMFIRMYVAGKFTPELSRVQVDDTDPAFYEGNGMIEIHAPADQVIASLQRMQ